MILMCMGILTGCGSGRGTDVYLEEESQQEICDTQQPVDGTSEAETVVTVYICGAVRHPGVYTLENGLRIADAIEAAGHPCRTGIDVKHIQCFIILHFQDMRMPADE